MIVVLLAACASALELWDAPLNSFSAEVDYYDIGRMGRGKNAGSWYHSYDKKVSIFYYLSMQPWRHFEWTSYESGVWVKRIMNEDRTETESKTPSQWCRKEYTYPIKAFELDIANGYEPTSKAINGETCYLYPAKAPLTSVYISSRIGKGAKVYDYTVCQMNFIGGKSITFRSFNSFDTDFYNTYNSNTTRLCTVGFTDKYVTTDVAVVYGIRSASIPVFIDKYLGDAIKSGSVNGNIKNVHLLYTDKQLVTKSFTSADALKGQVASLIVQNTNLNPAILEARKILMNRIKSGAVERGTILVIVDGKLDATLDISNEFDRNDVTIHAMLYRYAGNTLKLSDAYKMVSVGYHVYDVAKVSDADFKAAFADFTSNLRANLTERCSRKSCNGFCDSKDRCTCPMCCENTCYYTYCNTKTATCEKWPPANPLAKLTCANDCVGTRECVDMVGCVVKEYNKGCEPLAECKVPVCKKDSKGNEVCEQEDNCQQDVKPASDNRCHTYTCDVKSGKCVVELSGAECPAKRNCEEYYCTEDLQCKTQPKECVLSASQSVTDCYVAECNEATGQCETRLNCAKYSQCGGEPNSNVIPKCQCTKEGKCQCDKTATRSDNICDVSNGEYCDYTLDDPKCVKTNCLQDQTKDKCVKHVCNELTGLMEDVEVVCSDPNHEHIAAECTDYFSYECQDNECVVVPIKSPEKDGCMTCTYAEGRVTYTENCEGDGEEWHTAYCERDKTNPADKGECKWRGECEKSPDYIKTACAAKGYEWTLDETTGICIKEKKTTEECTQCSGGVDGEFVSTCNPSEDFEKTLLSTDVDAPEAINEFSFTYGIPKVCDNDNCIPTPDYDRQCQALYEKHFKIAEPCGGYVKYEYSSLFSRPYYVNGYKQKSGFYAEAVEKARCAFGYSKYVNKCGKCVARAPTADELAQNPELKHVVEFEDICTEPRVTDLTTLKCSDNGECVYETNTKCPIVQCVIYNVTAGMEASELASLDESEWEQYCEKKKDMCDDVKAGVRELAPDAAEEDRCAVFECDDSDPNAQQCVARAEDSMCAQPLTVDGTYGCRVRSGKCNPSTYTCEYKDLTLEEDPQHPEDYANQCVSYECKTNTATGGHEWVITLDNRHIDAYHLCDNAGCNPETGEIYHNERECHIDEAFPTLTEEQKPCFYCKCNYVTGNFTLMLFEPSEGKKFKIDSCGNCLVLDSQTDELILESGQEAPVCVFEDKVDNKGAIVGGTVAGIVVGAVVMAMVAVSIGVLQTYQLVSSAMKNAITTTVENPEFVAADTAATNANFTAN